MIGLGSRSISMGNTGVAGTDPAFSAFYNLAAAARARRTEIGLSLTGATTHFAEIPGIAYDSNLDGSLYQEDGQVETTTVGTSPAPQAGLGVGFVLPLLSVQPAPEALDQRPRFGLAFAMAAFLPPTGVDLSAADPYVPYYVMYNGRLGGFMVYAGAAAHVFGVLHVGAGARVALTTTLDVLLTADMRVDAFPEEKGGDASDLSIAATLDVRKLQAKIGFAMKPEIGVLIDFGGIDKRLRFCRIGGTWQASSHIPVTATVEAGVTGALTFDGDSIDLGALLAGGLTVPPVAMNAFFEPSRFTAGLQGGYGGESDEGGFVLGEVNLQYTRWSEFTETTIVIPDIDLDTALGMTISVKGSRSDPEPGFQDTLTPRVGLEGAFPRFKALKVLGPSQLVLRGGYAFVPTPVPEQTGITNYLDADRHEISFGVGYRLFPTVAGRERAVQLGFHGQLHQLISRENIKDLNLFQGEDGGTTFTAGFPMTGSVTASGWMMAVGGTLEIGL